MLQLPDLKMNAREGGKREKTLPRRSRNEKQKAVDDYRGAIGVAKAPLTHTTSPDQNRQ